MGNSIPVDAESELWATSSHQPTTISNVLNTSLPAMTILHPGDQDGQVEGVLGVRTFPLPAPKTEIGCLSNYPIPGCQKGNEQEEKEREQEKLEVDTQADWPARLSKYITNQ